MSKPLTNFVQSESGQAEERQSGQTHWHAFPATPRETRVPPKGKKNPKGFAKPQSCASFSSSELHKQLLTVYTIM